MKADSHLRVQYIAGRNLIDAAMQPMGAVPHQSTPQHSTLVMGPGLGAMLSSFPGGTPKERNNFKSVP